MVLEPRTVRGCPLPQNSSSFNNRCGAVIRKHVADYFDSDAVSPYLGLWAAGIKTYHRHRTLEEYLDAFLVTGLHLRKLADLTGIASVHEPGTNLPEGYRFPRFMLLAFGKPQYLAANMGLVASSSVSSLGAMQRAWCRVGRAPTHTKISGSQSAASGRGDDCRDRRRKSGCLESCGMPLNQTMYSFIEATVWQAGVTLLHYFRNPNLSIGAKGVGDLVTEADRASEQVLLAAIRHRFPDHGILSEEAGHLPAASRYEWLLDPLEATYNFSRGLPMWGINMALALDDEVVLGAFFDPLLDELYYAEQAVGAFRNGQPIRTSGMDDQGNAAVYCSTRANVDRLSGRVRKVRHIGSIGNALAYVAAGHLDGAVEVGRGKWDYAVGCLLVHEAGGKMTAFGVDSLGEASATVLAAATPALHQKLQRLLSG